VSDNGSCFRGETHQATFVGNDPLLCQVRTRVRSPQTNGVIERVFGTLKYEHLYRAPIDDGGRLAMETARFRDIYDRIRPHRSLGDRTPREVYVAGRSGIPFSARSLRHSTGRVLRDALRPRDRSATCRAAGCAGGGSLIGTVAGGAAPRRGSCS
jgi:hypothetical protein